MSVSLPTSRLYLTLPDIAPEQFERTGEQLDHLAACLDIACINLTLDHHWDTARAQPGADQKKLIIFLQQKNIAVLADLTATNGKSDRKSFEKALEQARIMSCDGIHMTADTELYDRARAVLGADAIIGAQCGSSRHLAMQLGEKGADYIAFGNEPPQIQSGRAGELGDIPDQLELVSWWQELFELPCVADQIHERTQLENLLDINTDFIALDPVFWSDLAEDQDFLSWLATRCPASQEVS